MNTYQCPHCPYQKDLWSIKRHMSRKHKTNQAGSGALEMEHGNAAHMQGASVHQQNLAISGPLPMNQPISPNNQETGTHVPMQNFKDYVQQWQEVYQNMQVRIKQLEEEIALLEACRNEDSNMLHEELQKVSILEPELGKLYHINKQWSEAYRQLQAHLQNQV